MAIKQRNQEIYKMACEYLYKIKPAEIKNNDLQKYFVGDRRDFSSLQDVYEQLIQSAQNYQRMPNVIKYHKNREKIKEILADFDVQQIKDYDIDELYYNFRREFNVKSTDNNYNSWHKWSKSVVDAAIFLADFKDAEDFKHFVSLFSYNLHTRMALPLLISTKIRGMGFALACDSLKELGYTEYPKPDVHLIDVFFALGLSEKEPIHVFEAIVRMSEDCREFDDSVTPYKIDKIIWLICSGRFYLDDISIGMHKKDFIEMIIKKI